MNDKEIERADARELSRSDTDLVRELGILAIKTLITLNSGAFVVLLTFIGNTAAQSQFSIPLGVLKIAMVLFLGGITFSFFAIAHSYILAQTTDRFLGATNWFERRYVEISVMLAAIAFLFFLAAVGVVIWGVAPAP
jgi:hypothetical protein